MEARHLLKALKDHGWYLGDTEDTFRQYIHKQHEGVVTVACRFGDDISPDAWNAVLTHAGIDPEAVKP